MSQYVYEVWAKRHSESPGAKRHVGSRDHAISKAIGISQASSLSTIEGAVSVWVEGPDGIVWAAGEKAQELREQGVEIEWGGDVAPAFTAAQETDD